MRAHLRFLCLSLALLCIGVVARAQLSGTITVPSTSYPDLASAITALNTQGVGTGGVVVNVTTGNTQYTPAGGYKLGSAVLNASLSASKTLVFNGNGNTIQSFAGTGSADGMWWLLGTDYVTINSFTLVDTATTTTTTSTVGMEYGIVLGKLNTTAPFDGCQYCTINGCTITMNSWIGASLSPTSVTSTTFTGNSTGIVMANISSSGAAITSTTGYTAADAHSYNKFTGNTISKVSRGIYCGANINVGSASLYDKYNQIGGSTTSQGNTITVGGNSGTTTKYGVIVTNDSNVTIQNNKFYIDAAQTGNAAVYFTHTGGNTVGTLNVLNNYYNVTNSNTSGLVAAYYNSSSSGATYGYYDAGGVMNINGNEVTGTGNNVTTATLYCFYPYYTHQATLNLNNNNIHDINWGNAANAATTNSNSVYCFYTYYSIYNITDVININNNTVSVVNRYGFGSIYVTYNYQYSAQGKALNIRNNNFNRIKTFSTTTSTSTIYTYLNYNYMYPGNTNGTDTRINLINNVYDSIDMSGVTNASTCYFYNYMNYYGGDSTTIRDNSFTNIKGSSGPTATGTNYWYAYNYYYYGPNGGVFSKNTYNNITANNLYFYGYSGYMPQYCDSNKVTNITGGAHGLGYSSPFYLMLGYYAGYYSSYWPRGYCRGNEVGNINLGIQNSGAYVYLGAYMMNGDLARNYVHNVKSTGSCSYYTYFGYYAYNGLNAHDNWIDSIQMNTGTIYAAYTYANGIVDTFTNNRVSNIITTGTSPVIYPWYLQCSSSSAGYNFWNNTVSNVEVPTNYSNTSTGIYGIYTAGTGNYNLYNNTIRISPSIPYTGTGYSATGIYYTTTGTLDLRNNIINVNVSPTGSGTVAALRRSGGTTGISPANFLGASNSNIYYAPNTTNSWLYAEGTSTAAINTYNLTNDPSFNTPCGLYKTFLGHNQADMTENNLSLSAVPGAYVPVGASYAEQGGTFTTFPAVTVDLAGVTRSVPSDIGALQFSGTVLDNAPPQIFYTALPAITYCLSQPTVVATITDQTGVGTGSNAPRLYYRKTTDANTFGLNNNTVSGWKYVTPTSVTGNQYTFNMDYSLLTSAPAAGTTIQYFIIAQDVTSSTNTGSYIAGFAVCPTSVNLTASNAPVSTTPAPNQFTINSASAFSASAMLPNICVSGSTPISLTPNPYGATLQWQSSPTPTGTYTSITGATSPNFQTPVLTSSISYRAVLYCGTSVLTTTAPVTVQVSNPVITSVTGASACGYSSVTLTAATNPGTSVNWYASATSTTPIATGTNFTTPYVSSSVTYYAAAVVPRGTTELLTKPLPASAANYTNPSYGYGMDFHFSDTTNWYSTLVYPTSTGNIAFVLTDLSTSAVVRSYGVTTPVTISGTGANLNSPTTLNLNWMNIPPGDYRMTFDPSNTVTLVYDYNGSQWPYPYYSSITGRSWISNGYYPGIGSYNYYYWCLFNNVISGPCENPTRYPVTATILPSAPITASSPNSPGICSGASASITATSTNGTYLYTWYPNVLFGSTSLTGATQTVSPTGTTKYYAVGIDPLTGCRAIDSISLFVNPQQAAPSITPVSPTICQNGAVQLTATPVPFGGTGTVGTGTITNGTYGFPSPGGNEWTADHEQYLLTPAELNAAGIFAGQLNSIGFNLAAGYTGYALQQYTIRMAQTTLTSVNYTSFLCSGFTTVYGPATYTPPSSAGWATIPFTTPFNWNGTSNILIDITFTNGGTSCGTSFNQCMNVYQSSTSYNASAWAAADGNCSIITCSPSSPSVYGNLAQRPNMRFDWGKPYTLKWINVTGLYKNYPPLSGAMTTADTNRKVWASPTTTQVYTAVTNAQGCLSLPSNPDTVFVNPAPPTTISPAGAQTICSGNSVTLCAPTGASMTYQWLLNNSPIAGATANCYTATAAGSYRVKVTNLGSSCFDTSTATVVTVNSLPTVSVTPSGPTTFCNGGAVTLAATTNASPGVYQWYDASGAIAGQIGPNLLVTQSGSYYVKVLNANQCSAQSTPITVTVNTIPSTITPAGSTTFCTGGSVVLNAPTAGTGAPYTYTWSNGSTVGTGSSYTASAAGSYTVTVSSASTGCQSTSSATIVTVGAAPSSAITPSASTTLCSAGTVTLSTNSAPGLTYQWYNGSTAIGAPSGTASTLVVGPSTTPATGPGSYTVKVSIASQTTCNSTTATPTVVNLSTNPTSSFTAAGSTTFCQGSTVGLTYNGTSGVTYQWNLNGSPITGATSGTYAANAGGSYTVTATNSAGCSTTSASQTLTANPLPNVNVTTSGPSAICAGGTIILTSSTGSTYQWKNNGTSITGATSGTYSANTTGNYTVTVTDANGCSNTSTPVAVLVNPLPTATTSPTGTVNVCQGTSVTLTTPSQSNTTYQWRNGPTAPTSTAINGATGTSYTTATGGTYYIQVTNTVTGCTNTSAAVVVSTNTPPVATATRVGAATICSGDSSLINANTGTGLSYQWNYNGSPIAGATGATLYAKNQGTYTVTVSNGTNCATTSTGVALAVNPAPAAFITYNAPLTFCDGSAVALTANTGTGLSYVWYVNNTATTNTTTNYVATASGIYKVKTTNGFGCSTMSDTLQITVNPAPKPVISRVATTMTTTQSYSSYQWFFNNVAIGGATNQTYVASQNGAYKVRVIDANGCEGFSELEFVQNVGVTPTATSIAIKVYPNPTTGLLKIDAPVKVSVVLRDVTGKAVVEESEVKQLDITNVASGMYLLYISDMSGKLLRVDKVTKTTQH